MTQFLLQQNNRYLGPLNTSLTAEQLVAAEYVSSKGLGAESALCN